MFADIHLAQIVARAIDSSFAFVERNEHLLDRVLSCMEVESVSSAVVVSGIRAINNEHCTSLQRVS